MQGLRGHMCPNNYIYTLYMCPPTTGQAVVNLLYLTLIYLYVKGGVGNFVCNVVLNVVLNVVFNTYVCVCM